jgi:ribonuclease HII
LAWGIGKASVNLIDKKGIIWATNFAFRSAIGDAQSRGNCRITFLLIDAFYVPYVRGINKANQNAIVKGDSISFSIAAASIIAKVYRDQLMVNLGKKPNFEKYGWLKNKGYGTKEHRNSITSFGVTPHHRRLWVKNY